MEKYGDYIKLARGVLWRISHKVVSFWLEALVCKRSNVSLKWRAETDVHRSIHLNGHAKAYLRGRDVCAADSELFISASVNEEQFITETGSVLMRNAAQKDEYISKRNLRTFED